LTAADLERYPIWVFPMDQSVEDEASVRPVQPGEVVPDGLQTIVRCVFRDRSGRELPGYLYASGVEKVEDVKPVAWCGSLCVTFWNGIIEPSSTYVAEIKNSGLSWPVSYETIAEGFPVQRGTLNGVYFREGNVIRCVGGTG